MVHDYVSLLVERGWVEVAPRDHGIAPAAIKRASQAVEFLVTALARFAEQAAITRDGEQEPDLFLLIRAGQAGTDRKHFLHYAHDLEQHLPEVIFDALTEQEKNELKVVQNFYFELNRFVAQVVRAVFVNYPHYFSDNIMQRYNDAAVVSQPYATSCLRGLWYPPHDWGAAAKAHFDRDFITAHCGDEGGQLYGHTSLTGGSLKPLSPEAGNIILFWGVKALLLTNGKLMPLFHSATATPMKERRALVFFGQVATREPVANSQQSWQTYCHSRGIHNPTDFYQRRFQS